MIRDRRPEDMDRLCAIVAMMGFPADSLAESDPRTWVEGDSAEHSWVYDMAPVHVVPTKNVVGHVQIYRPDGASSTPELARSAARPVSELLAIGRLVVTPQKHDGGIARHLLKEARIHIERQGKTAVLDLRVNGYLTEDFCRKYGFTRLASDDPGASPMIYAG